MNKRIKVLFMFILAFIIMIGFNNKAFAAKWSDLSTEQQNEYKKYAWGGATTDEIETVCLYTQAYTKNETGIRFQHFFFVYKDGTSSVGWSNRLEIDGTNSTGVDPTAANNDAGRVNRYSKNGDGSLANYDSLRADDSGYHGVRNWSKNKDFGDKSGVNSNAPDAYANYKEGKCPQYMTNHEDNEAHTFYLSSSNTLSNFTEIKELAKKDKKAIDGMYDTNIYYYNYPITSAELNNVSENLECKYKAKDSEGDSSDIIVNFTTTGDVSVEKNDGNFYIGNDKYNIQTIKLNTGMRAISFLSQISDGCPMTLSSCSYNQPTSKDVELIGDYSQENEKFCSYDGGYPFTFECIGDNCSSKTICAKYYDYEADLDKKLSEYKNSPKNSTSAKKILDEYNVIKSDFNAWCVSILSHADYAEGTCVKSCIDLSKIIADKEQQHGLRSAYGKEKCNIGEQVLSMVYNVLKWAKYIAPVLVIILSILDFIKALAAQSDDEMKKAQGKFVKRLIVAALLFLLPLIINFALKTFGFYNAGCDITDLF